MEKPKRIKSGIPGVDSMLAGGFIEGSVTLLCGGYGTGKSTFAMQFLAEGAKDGEPGLYITFDQDPQEIIKEGDIYGWNFSGLVEKKILKVIRVPAIEMINTVEAGFGEIGTIVKSMNIKRVIVDSIISFDLVGKDAFEKRHHILELVSWIKKQGATALFTMEVDAQKDELGEHLGMGESAADGIIYLYHPKKGDKRTRQIEVLKMRETCHDDKIHAFSISAKGISIKTK